jgi:hypothetical protein
MNIEVNVPKDVDLDHAYHSVMDALYHSENVSMKEVLLVSNVLNVLASKKVVKNGFREWAETHHEIVCTIHAMIDNETMPAGLEKVIDKEGLGGLYDLGIDLTNEFCNTYVNHVWDGDWIDTIIEFINVKLK